MLEGVVIFYLIVIVFLYVGFYLIGASVAKSYGMSPALWGWISVLIGIFGILLCFIVGAIKGNQEPKVLKKEVHHYHHSVK